MLDRLAFGHCLCDNFIPIIVLRRRCQFFSGWLIQNDRLVSSALTELALRQHLPTVASATISVSAAISISACLASPVAAAFSANIRIVVTGQRRRLFDSRLIQRGNLRFARLAGNACIGGIHSFRIRCGRWLVRGRCRFGMDFGRGRRLGLQFAGGRRLRIRSNSCGFLLGRLGLRHFLHVPVLYMLVQHLFGQHLVDHRQQMHGRMVGEAHEACRQLRCRGRYHPLDEPLVARLGDQRRQRISGNSEGLEARRRRNDAALGIDDGRILAGLVEPGDGARRRVGRAAPRRGWRRHGEQDCIFTIRQGDLAGDEGNRTAGHAAGQPHGDRTILADRRIARRRHDLPLGGKTHLRLCADDRFDVGKAEQLGARPVGPDHLVEAGRQDCHGVAGSKALPHRIERRYVEIGVLARWH